MRLDGDWVYLNTTELPERYGDDTFGRGIDAVIGWFWPGQVLVGAFVVFDCWAGARRSWETIGVLLFEILCMTLIIVWGLTLSGGPAVLPGARLAAVVTLTTFQLVLALTFPLWTRVRRLDSVVDPWLVQRAAR